MCGLCKHGHDTRPTGEKTSPGTVWCDQRKLQMARGRQMPCFVMKAGLKVNHCADCKRARMLTQSGVSPRPGNVWCGRKQVEINRQRTMECFE